MPEAATRWFYWVPRNAVIDHARRRAASSRKLAAFAQELEATGGDDETSAQVCQCVARIAETLKPEYAQAVPPLNARATREQPGAKHRA